ncbi:MAG: SDR family oxidoreductase [Rhodobacteraceae bacterium]|nr:MAG: SDR family oxidoreductase [Paracoccaceae bacterium]
MSVSILGKTAIVTGAANGVGLAISRHFIQQGANVVLADMDEDSLKSEVNSLENEKGKAISFSGDLREKLTQANLLSATIDEFDRVDILVNASRQFLISDPLNSEEDSFETLLSQNLITNLRISQLIAKRMIRQAKITEDVSECVGSIINLTSMAGRRAQPEILGYSVSCAAVEQLTRSLAVALASHSIRVNAVCFGSVMSGSLKDSLRANGHLREKIISATPLRRIGEAKEVADAVQYLASNSASFVTGQILTVDGGRTQVDSADVFIH